LLHVQTHVLSSDSSFVVVSVIPSDFGGVDAHDEDRWVLEKVETGGDQGEAVTMVIVDEVDDVGGPVYTARLHDVPLSLSW
jgi:hypothetical protein